MPNQIASKIRGDFCIETRPAPAGVVIFGASGDLTARKLLPSLFELFQKNLLPKNFFVLGCARTAMSDESFRLQMRDDLNRFVHNLAPAKADEFIGRCYYQAGAYDSLDLYISLRERLAALDAEYKTVGNVLFYLATPPSLYETVVSRLGQADLTTQGENGGRWRRVIIEKPFGRDLDSALMLDRHLHCTLEESQLYRIDHYLGKETVQNLLMFRFANAIFEPVWNRRYIDHVKITVAESVGVGRRTGYFEQAGVMRDMFQNHMLQMLALVAMEPPASFNADRVRDEKVKLLRSIRPFDTAQVDQWLVRGQYTRGHQGGQDVTGYRELEGVAPDSMVETYLAARLMIDNWRWQGVPFYLRSGKCLSERMSQIAITFKPVPHSMFSPIRADELTPNVLIMNVQPDEGVSLIMQAKHPGPKLCMSALKMDFLYSEVFEESVGDAYERLLLDALLGDQTLFVRHDDMEVAWSLITPVLEKWAQQGSEGKIYPYAPGSWGPCEAEQLLTTDGRQWRNPIE